MPMSFPTHAHVQQAATVWNFRAQRPDESDADYRKALADFVTPHDRIEAHEIRTGKGWDQWNDEENAAMLFLR